MRFSTMKGLAAGGMIGMTVGAGLMMTTRGKRMQRVLMKSGSQFARQLLGSWM